MTLFGGKIKHTGDAGPHAAVRAPHGSRFRDRIPERPSALALLVPGFTANHPHYPAAAHHLAVATDFFNRGSDFHATVPKFDQRHSTHARHAAGAITDQARLFHQRLVLVAHQVRLQLREKIDGHHHDN